MIARNISLGAPFNLWMIKLLKYLKMRRLQNERQQSWIRTAIITLALMLNYGYSERKWTSEGVSR